MAEDIRGEPREQFSAYVVIPARVFFDREITDRARLLYGLISNMCNQRGSCWAKNATLARFLGGAADSTVRRLLKELKDHGYIRVEDDDGGANVRKIHLADSLPVYPLKNERVPAQKSAGTRPNMSGLLNNDLITKEIITPQTPPGVSPELLDGFSEALTSAITDWLAYKAERRENYRPLGIKSLIGRTRRAAEAYGDAAVLDTIERSMAAGYQGIAWDWAARYKPEETKTEREEDYW